VEKTDIRKKILEARKALSPTTRNSFSKAIIQKVMGHPQWRSAKTILVTISFGSEVETHSLIHQGFAQGKRIVVPVVTADDPELSLSELRYWNDLEKGPTHGILQPKADKIRLVSPSEIDVALIPGAAYDRKGGRIGYGAGYFDRLLPSMTKAYSIGLAFSIQIVDHLLPLEPHDCKVDEVITETSNSKFKIQN